MAHEPQPPGRSGASRRAEAPRPPPLRVAYASYGVALTGDAMLHAGSTCREGIPCVLGGGGGLTLRGGYRWPSPWYVGGAYQIARTDSANLYRLATLQQLRVEVRHVLDLTQRTIPYVQWGAGAVAYGNELGIDTGGAGIFAGLGVEFELSRLATMGVAARYQPVALAAFRDAAGFERPWGVAHFTSIEVQLELRHETSTR